MTGLDLGVYVVTDRTLGAPGSFWDSLEAVLEAGVTCLQVREKGSARDLYETARRILPLTRRLRIPLVVNDRLDVAMALDADGVHLGQSDLDAEAARRLWGPGKWIGVSARTEAQIRQAEAHGADYLGIGALYPTTTKVDTEAVTLGRLAALVRATPLPVVGIGGVTPRNARAVFEAGARGVAVVSAVWASDQPVEVVRALKALAEEFSK